MSLHGRHRARCARGDGIQARSALAPTCVAKDVAKVGAFGSHTGRTGSPEDLPVQIPNGTKLLDIDADAGKNFLSSAIDQVAKDRVATPQIHQTLEPRRLRRDLLSSMPMAFNLFGEASLAVNVSSRSALAKLFKITPDLTTDIIFEWSPCRTDSKYTRDRTAFDVALRVGGPAGPRTVVGIETKFHEHSVRESLPQRRAEARQVQRADRVPGRQG